MYKSLWLHKVMIKMLEYPDTALSTAFRWFYRVMGARECAVYLMERSPENGRVIMINNETAVCYPITDEKDKRFRSLYRKVTEAKVPVYVDNMCAFPMVCDKADFFGVTVCDTAHTPDDKLLKESFSAFCSVVYSEIMGGFLKSSNPVALRVVDISMNYHNNTESVNTVDHVSLEINQGELTVIMGRSGCGKSTLLNIMGGMLTPTSGSVFWGDTDICTFTDRQKTAYRRDALGFIFQNYNLLGDLTALENVAVAASLSKNSHSSLETLEQVGLAHKADCHPGQMSGGEQQRVCIARALVKRAGILLCDEPTGALDTENAKNVMCILQGIAKEQRIPVVVVTHNPEFSVLADHYIEMSNGIIVKDDYQPFPFWAESVLK